MNVSAFSRNARTIAGSRALVPITTANGVAVKSCSVPGNAAVFTSAAGR
jgi:hypothetical protein